MEIASETDHIRKHHVTMAKKETYMSKNLQFQNISSFFIHKKKWLLSPTSVLSHSHIAYNTTAFLDNLPCTNYVVFGEMPGQIWTTFLVQKWFQLLACKTQSFQKRWQQKFRLVQNLTTGEAEFKQFMRLTNQLVNAAENIGRGENLFQVLIPTRFKNMDEQPKLVTRWLT